MWTLTVAGVDSEAGAPDVIHELQAGKYLVGVGEELVEQAKFLLGQDLLPAVGGDGEGVVVQEWFFR